MSSRRDASRVVGLAGRDLSLFFFFLFFFLVPVPRPMGKLKLECICDFRGEDHNADPDRDYP